MALYAKYGIPMDGLSPRDVTIQPKLRFKFRVRFVNFGGLESASYSFDSTQQVISVGRPKITFESTELGTYAGSIKVFNKPKFENITVTFRDDIANSLSGAVASQLQKQYDFNEGRYAVSGGASKFTMIIETLDGVNEMRAVDAFRLEGCFIESADFGSLNYAESTFNEIPLVISYDYLGGYYSEVNGVESAKQLFWYVTSNASTMATPPHSIIPNDGPGVLSQLTDQATNAISSGVNSVTNAVSGFFNSDDEE